MAPRAVIRTRSPIEKSGFMAIPSFNRTEEQLNVNGSLDWNLVIKAPIWEGDKKRPQRRGRAEASSSRVCRAAQHDSKTLPALIRFRRTLARPAETDSYRGIALSGFMPTPPSHLELKFNTL